jgi:hypothetical protein
MSREAKSVALALVLCSAILAAPVQAQSITPLSVYDANGKSVGPVLGFADPRFSVNIQIGPAPIVALRTNGLVVVLGVLQLELFGTQPTLFFESTDCSGTPLLPALTGTVTTPTAVQGDTVYVGTGSPSTVTPHSELFVNVNAPGACGADVILPAISVVQAVPLFKVSSIFKAPFTMR